VSVSVATESSVLGQFASNNGYQQLVKASSIYRYLTSFFENGASEHIPEVQKELAMLIKYCKNADIVSSAKELSKLLEGQDCVVVTDGTSNSDVEKQDGPQDATVSKSNNGNGVMVGFWFAPDIAKLLAVDVGEDANQLHITLAYMGKLDEIEADKIPALENVLHSFGLNYAPVHGTLGGPIRFNASEASDGKDVCVASFQSKGIQDFRSQLCDWIKFAGLEPKNNFDYTPHCTLAYIAPEDPMPVQRVEPIDVTFNKITLVLGPKHIEYDLIGATVCKWDNEDEADEDDSSEEDDRLEPEDEQENTDKVELSANIIKLDNEKQLVFGWFSVVSVGGHPITDTQGDVILEHTLESSAYEFVLTARKGGEMHETNNDGTVRGVGRLVESVVFTKEKQQAMAQSLKEQGIDAQLDLGCSAWWGGMKIDDADTWNRVKTGELRAWSIGGRGKRAQYGT